MKNSDESHKITETVYKVNFILCRVLYVHHTCTLKKSISLLFLANIVERRARFPVSFSRSRVIFFYLFGKKKIATFVTDKSMPMHL